MDFGEQRRRLGAWMVAGASAVALTAVGHSAVWADQSNDNTSTTTAAAGDPIVIPVTGALQVNLACPANVNVLADQAGTGSCAPDAQSNANSSSTNAAGGTLVVPVTAAGQLNWSCPINVNVISNQRDAGNCAPGDQSNSNSAQTSVVGGGPLADFLGGPVVVPVTTGAGLNVTCPTNVNVLGGQEASGECGAQPPASDSGPPPADTGPPPDASPPPDAPPADAPPTLDSPPGVGGGSLDAPARDLADAAPDAAADAPGPLPGPPTTGAFGVGGAAGGFPVLGALVLAVLVAAALAARWVTRQR